MKLEPEHCEVINWPQKPQGGMQVGKAYTGVRITHKPTNSVVECSHFRSQHKNKEAAMAAMELLIKDA